MNQKRIEAIKELQEQGLTKAEICRELNISYTMYRYYSDEEYRLKTIKRVTEYNKKHKRIPDEKYREYQRNYQKERYNTDSEFRRKQIARNKK